MTTRSLTWAAAALFLLAACAGTVARQEVLLPAMRQAWAGIRDQVGREALAAGDAAGGAEVAAADAALETGDVVAIAAVRWSVLDQLAEADVARRVAAGAISAGVGASLRERLARFIESRSTYLRTTP